MDRKRIALTIYPPKEELKTKIEELAKKDGRTTSQYICRLLEKHLQT